MTVIGTRPNLARISTATRQARAPLPLVFLLAVRLALGVAYSLSVPVWEAVDEDGHFAYARYLAKHGVLPQVGDPEAEKIRENFQPPLYYLLLVPVIAAFDLGRTFEAPVRNPYLFNGDGGFNYAVHPAYLQGVAQSTALAVYAARVLSVLLSTASVIPMYFAARRVWPAEPHSVWTTICLYAFWPQFLFLGSMVTNDMLVTVLSAVLFYFAIRLASDGFRLKYALALSATLGAALLTKLNAIGLIPTAAVALVMSLRQTFNWKSPRPWLAFALLSLVVGVALWLLSFLRFVTAQILQTQTATDFLRYANPGPASLLNFTFLLPALRHTFQTFLASFGWGNLEAPGGLYWAWALGANLAVVGLSLSWIERARGAPFKIIVLAMLPVVSLVALVLALDIAHNVFLPGRYVLPALPGVAFLLVGGWRALLPKYWRPYIWKGLCLSLVLVGWAIPFTTLAPAYVKPQPLPNITAIDDPLHIFFADDIELLGYLRPPAFIPGREFQVTLCWQAVAPVQQNYSVLLELAGPDGQVYSRLETYPGRGNYATSLWAAHAPFCEQYTLPARPIVPASSPAYLHVSLLDGVGGYKLPVKNSTGEAVGQEIQLPVEIRN